MRTMQPGEEQQNNREQGKLNTGTIIRELTTTGKPKKLYEIALEAGSKAKTKKELATAVTQKVANSTEIQLALQKHREKTLKKHDELQDKLFSKLLDENGIDGISPEKCLESVTKEGNLIATLTKQSEGSSTKTPTAIQINIIQSKKDK